MSVIKNWKFVSPALLIFLLLWIFFCFWFPLTDTDIWWHLAAAKWMWVHHAIPFQDPFCASSFKTPWIDLHWVFQIVMGAVFRGSGEFGLIFFKCVLMACATGLLLWPHWNKRTAYRLFPLTLLGTFLIRYFIDVRPLIFTLVFLSGQYALLQFYFRRKIKSAVWLILLLQIGMANVQGLFYLGSFLITLLIGAELYHRHWQHDQKKSLIALIGLSWGVGILNPYGWQGVKLPLLLLHRIQPVSNNIFSDQIAENEPWIHWLKSNPNQILPWFLFLSVACYFAMKGFRKSSRGPLLVFIVFILLGFMAIRNLPLVVVAGLMVAAQGSERDQNETSFDFNGLLKKYFASMGIAVILVVTSAISIVQAWQYEIPVQGESPFRFPSGAVSFLKSHSLPGQMFNELRYGGYIDYYLYPTHSAFIDGRMVLHTADFFVEYLVAVDHPEKFSAYRNKVGVTFVLLPISENSRFVPLCQYLLFHEKWQFGFCDGASLILVAPEIPVTGALQITSALLEETVNREIDRRFGENSKLLQIAHKNVEELLYHENEINKTLQIP